jgi:hypothetical protein
MLELKTIFGLLAVVLTFVGYIPYIVDTIKGKTKPHLYSWFLWSLVTFIIFALQVLGNAGAGAFVTLATAILCLVEFILGFRSGERDITTFDTVMFVISLIAIAIWVFAKQPMISNLLIITINTFAVVPTIRKSWHKPESETLFSWIMAGTRNVLGILALDQFSLLTWLYPVSSLITNVLFSAMLIVRRKQLAQHQQ